MAQQHCKVTSDGNSPGYKAQRGQKSKQGAARLQAGCSPEEHSRGHQSPTLYSPGDCRVTWSHQGQDLGILVAQRNPTYFPRKHSVLTDIYAVSLSHTIIFHFQIHLLSSQKENVPVKKITNNETLDIYVFHAPRDSAMMPDVSTGLQLPGKHPRCRLVVPHTNIVTCRRTFTFPSSKIKCSDAYEILWKRG